MNAITKVKWNNSKTFKFHKMNPYALRLYLRFLNSCEIWNSFSRAPIRTFSLELFHTTYYIDLYPLKSVKKNAIWLLIFWYKVSVHWKLKFLNSLTESVLILFVYNMIRGCSKWNRENYWRKYFWLKKRKPRFRFNLGSALNGLRTTGPFCFVGIKVKRQIIVLWLILPHRTLPVKFV